MRATKEIKFWLIFLFGNAVIIFFNMATLAGIWFGDDFVWLIGYLLANFIILPQTGFIEERNRYLEADRKTDFNPLYVSGHFRKRTENPVYWSNLKGIFYCQLIMLILMGMVWGIFLLIYVIPSFYYSDLIGKLLLIFYRFFKSNTIMIVMGIIFWGLFLVWLGFHIYYRWCYNEAFRYTRNEEGIWQPYSYIAKRHGWGAYRPFDNYYYIRYKRMQENLRMSCPANGYQYVDSYEIENREGESDLYVKYMRNAIRIFQLIHVREYTENTMKQLNEIFSDFWKTYIGNNNKAEKASVLFLLCVEEYSKELEKRLLSVCSVDQKKGRNRVAAVMTYYGKPSLTILDSYGMVRGKKKYRELRGEMLTLLGMSEKNNHKSYGDKEEYGELKEISEEDLNAILDDIEDESWD